jgi:hypothetical protein
MPDRSEGRGQDKCCPSSSRLDVRRGDPYNAVAPVRKKEAVVTPQ